MAGAIRGSINSWSTGDFGYDASNPYSDTLNAGQQLSDDQIASLAKLQISEETAGLFNIPVCQMFDLRFFPPASGSKSRLSEFFLQITHFVKIELHLLTFRSSGSCSACQQSVGGTPGSTKRFGDNINKIVTSALGGPPNKIYCGGYYGNSCSYSCPQSLYNGTSF